MSDMQENHRLYSYTDLCDIFRYRIDALSEIYSVKVKTPKNENIFVSYSLVAQDYIYQKPFGKINKKLLTQICEKYNVKMDISARGFGVPDLIKAYYSDIKAGVIDNTGCLLTFPQTSSVLKIPHENLSDGIPLNATVTIKDLNLVVLAKLLAKEK